MGAGTSDEERKTTAIKFKNKFKKVIVNPLLWFSDEHSGKDEHKKHTKTDFRKNSSLITFLLYAISDVFLASKFN